MRFKILPFIILLFVNFCFAQNYSLNNLFIRQGSRLIEIKQTENIITLHPSDFSIEYLNKPYEEKKGLFYNAQALITGSAVDVSLKDGSEITSIAYFEPGTGFSAEKNEVVNYPLLSSDGHQYLYYISNKDKRIDKIGVIGNWDIYSWTLKGVYQYDAEIDWSDYENDQVHIVFIIDRNLDGLLQSGEYYTLHIQFEK